MEHTIKCPLCNSDNFAIFDNVKLNQFHQRFYCIDCCMIFIAPEPSVHPAYDHAYNDYFRRPTDIKKAGVLACTIAELIGTDNTETRILEIGCGNGWTSMLLQQLFKNTVAHEIDEKHAFQVAKTCNLPMVFGKFEKQKFLHTFDFIYAGHVIEHSWQPNEFLQTCFSLLAENGRLFLDTPDPSFIDHKASEWHHFKTRDPLEHCCIFHKHTMQYAAEKNGFKVLWIQQDPKYQSFQILLEKV